MTRIDPRYYQLFVQVALLSWGLFGLQFNIPLSHIAAAFSSALLFQFAFTYYLGLKANPLSAINTTMSILLLLHASSWQWIALAVIIAISSKFIIRFQNKHLFNPSNIGIVAVLLITDSAWAAPGQWGQAMWLALLLAGIGLIFIIGINRMLTSISFLLVYAGLIFIRALWLGDPVPVPVHQLQNGALLIFAFFMLSDPMTTPTTAKGRFLFGSWVAIIGWILQFGFFIPNAFLYALALSMPLVSQLNRDFQGTEYHWPSNRTTK